MLRIISIILLLFFLNGCTYLENMKNIQFVKPKDIQTNESINTTLNQTNETINVTITQVKNDLIYNPDYPNIFIPSTHSILIREKNSSYLIDAPKDNLKILNLIKSFQIDELEFAIMTIDKEGHNGGMQYIVTNSPPKKIFDNGINDQYRQNYIYRLDKYNSYWNRTSAIYEIVIFSFYVGDFGIFAPYALGLSSLKDENSIVVQYQKRFLYMSDCYGNCESKIPPLKTEFLVLANKGECPTTSFDFVLNTAAKYVIAENGVCSELKESLDFVGINQILLKDKGTMQIILMEDGLNEIRYETP